MLIPADATSQLVQIRKAVSIRLIDENGIGIGDVETTFDDRGGDEDIRAPLHKSDHRRFHRIFVHLSMHDVDRCFRNQCVNFVGNRLDIVNAVMNEIDLAISIQLTNDCRTNQFTVPAAYPSLYGHAILRRSFKIRDIANPHQ